jgi:hypothetical protein
MHPSGIQYGLSRGLLQLRGEEVLLSDEMLEAISVKAQLRMHLKKPAIDGNYLVLMTVEAAEEALEKLAGPQGRRQETVPFFAHLNRMMYYTCGRVGERAKITKKEPRKLMTEPTFWDEFSATVVDVKIKPGDNPAKIEKAIFKVCHKLVKKRFAANDPDNARHADLIAFFMFNFWNASGLLPMAQALVMFGGIPDEDQAE